MKQPRWCVCPKCGVLGRPADPHIDLSRTRCHWCNVAPRWLTAAETDVFTQNRELQEAHSSGKNVSMAAEQGKYTFTVWGANKKRHARDHFRPRKRR